MSDNIIDLKDVDLLLKVGIQYYDKKDYKNAYRIFSRIININEHQFEAHFYLSAIYEIIGNYEEAISEFEILIRLRPDDFDLKEFLMNLYTKRNKYKKAISLFKALFEKEPYSFKYWEMLIDLLINANKLNLFINLTGLIENYRSMANDILLRTMLLYRDSDQITNALLISEILLKLDHQNPINHYFIGTIYEAINDKERLEEEFKTTSKLLKSSGTEGNILYQEIYKRLKELGIN
ncbi:MAG: tetratricopeptide repeat protein [Spirochaetota bacterium]